MESVRLEFEPFIAERELALRTLATSLPYRVWNGIFAAGDGRAKRHLKTTSLRRDRKSETTGREKWPQKRLFCRRAWTSGFRKTGWWAHQGSNLGPAD